MAAIVAILKYIKWHFLPNQKSDLADTWWEASVWHEDSELVKSFCPVIKDGHHGGHLEIFKQYLPRRKTEWAKTLEEGLGQHGG